MFNLGLLAQLATEEIAKQSDQTEQKSSGQPSKKRKVQIEANDNSNVEFMEEPNDENVLVLCHGRNHHNIHEVGNKSVPFDQPPKAILVDVNANTNPDIQASVTSNFIKTLSTYLRHHKYSQTPNNFFNKIYIAYCPIHIINNRKMWKMLHKILKYNGVIEWLGGSDSILVDVKHQSRDLFTVRHVEKKRLGEEYPPFPINHIFMVKI